MSVEDWFKHIGAYYMSCTALMGILLPPHALLGKYTSLETLSNIFCENMFAREDCIYSGIWF